MDDKPETISDMAQKLSAGNVFKTKEAGKALWYMSMTSTIIDLFKVNEALTKEMIAEELRRRETAAPNELIAQSCNEAARRIMME